jgi:Matrixin
MRGGPIHLKTRDLTAAAYPATQSLGTVKQGPGHVLVQFTGVARADTIRELRRRGARIVAAAPDGGLTISLARPTSLDGLGIAWSGPLLARDKISPMLPAGAAPAAVLIEFHPDVNPRRIRQLLRARNVPMLRHPDLAPNHILVSAPPAAWADLAKLDEVAYIFPASADLIQGNHVMACAGPLTAQGPVGQYVTVGSGWGGAGPDGVVELDYFFAQMSQRLPAAGAQSEIQRALQEWAKYANIRFVAGNSATAARTVSIMFARGVHGDGYPFEPGSGVLAHTFFPAPPNGEPIAGDMHLNDDQNWHIGSDIDLYTVALHEAGHALGLGHTDDPTAIMYPYYRFGATLGASDIAGVQALYGSPDNPQPPVTPPTPPVTPPPATPVSVVISNPAATVTTTASSMALSGTASGGSGNLQVTWANDQGGAGQAVGSANWSIAYVALSPGVNNITVRASDGAGDNASASIAVTQQSTPVTPPNPPPAGPPSLTIVSPSLSIVSTALASITLSGTASSSVTSVTWSNSTGSSGNASGTTSWTAAGIPLLVGTNTITVRALNAANQSAWRSLTVVRE